MKTPSSKTPRILLNALGKADPPLSDATIKRIAQDLSDTATMFFQMDMNPPCPAGERKERLQAIWRAVHDFKRSLPDVRALADTIPPAINDKGYSEKELPARLHRAVSKSETAVHDLVFELGEAAVMLGLSVEPTPGKTPALVSKRNLKAGRVPNRNPLFVLARRLRRVLDSHGIVVLLPEAERAKHAICRSFDGGQPLFFAGGVTARLPLPGWKAIVLWAAKTARLIPAEKNIGPDRLKAVERPAIEALLIP